MDLPLLYEGVKLGGALDYPTKTGHESMPPGLTALHLAIMAASGMLRPEWAGRQLLFGQSYVDAKMKRCVKFIETLIKYG